MLSRSPQVLGEKGERIPEEQTLASAGFRLRSQPPVAVRHVELDFPTISITPPSVSHQHVNLSTMEDTAMATSLYRGTALMVWGSVIRRRWAAIDGRECCVERSQSAQPYATSRQA